MDIVIRRALPSDTVSMARVYMDAFGFQGDVHRVKLVYEISLEVQLDGCYVACIDREIVGVGCFYQHDSLAWIGAVATMKAFQRRGIGIKIVSTLIDELKKRNVVTIRLDSTEAGLKLYRKLGFVEKYKTIMFDLERIELRYREVINDVNIEVLDKIDGFVATIDRKVFGTNRLHVINTWLRYGAKLLVLEDCGYAMIWRDRVGPLVAVDSRAAQILLLKAIELGAKKIIVSEANREAMKLMEVLGAREVCMYENEIRSST